MAVDVCSQSSFVLRLTQTQPTQADTLTQQPTQQQHAAAANTGQLTVTQPNVDTPPR